MDDRLHSDYSSIIVVLSIECFLRKKHYQSLLKVNPFHTWKTTISYAIINQNSKIKLVRMYIDQEQHAWITPKHHVKSRSPQKTKSGEN